MSLPGPFDYERGPIHDRAALRTDLYDDAALRPTAFAGLFPRSQAASTLEQLLLYRPHNFKRIRDSRSGVLP